MQLGQITSMDALSAFTVFRALVQGIVGIFADPTEQSHKKIGFARAIPDRWGSAFPMVFTVATSLVTVERIFVRLENVDDKVMEGLDDMIDNLLGNDIDSSTAPRVAIETADEGEHASCSRKRKRGKDSDGSDVTGICQRTERDLGM